jgi:hypothetical protein
MEKIVVIIGIVLLGIYCIRLLVGIIITKPKWWIKLLAFLELIITIITLVILVVRYFS